MRLLLPGGTVAVFTRKRHYERGEVVLVEHPEHGRLIRRIYAIGRHGRYSLDVINRDQSGGLGMIEPEWIRGGVAFRLL
ncbi:MAG: S24/S26 family peptidase [Erythrobacter sp.]|jgi:hypothetical protein|nr:S24/S26 family peptidase [Erythrobacter sp.]